jgi:hypothetical protein
MKSILIHITAAIVLMAFSTAAPIDDVTVRLAKKRKPSVLFVGNSYSFVAPKAFRTYASNRGRELRVDQVTHGGWTLAQHATSEDTLKKIREGGWDVVVIQEQSRIPSLPAARRETMMSPALRKLVEESRKHGAVPVLYQTWGWRDGDKALPKDDFHAMTGRLRDGYQAAGKAENIAVVPVGDVWDREFSAGKSAKLFQKDGSHPSAYGNEVTAKVFYETLFPKRK